MDHQGTPKKWTFYKSDLLKYNLLTVNSLFLGIQLDEF